MRQLYQKSNGNRPLAPLGEIRDKQYTTPYDENVIIIPYIFPFVNTLFQIFRPTLRRLFLSEIPTVSWTSNNYLIIDFSPNLCYTVITPVNTEQGESLCN